jgi:hypothetical protein
MATPQGLPRAGDRAARRIEWRVVAALAHALTTRSQSPLNTVQLCQNTDSETSLSGRVGSVTLGRREAVLPEENPWMHEVASTGSEKWADCRRCRAAVELCQKNGSAARPSREESGGLHPH